jgi:hypothetical protein
MFGPAGRQLALLFPAGSYRARHVPVPVIVLGYLAGIAAGALVLLLRQAGRPPWDTLWAEDGSRLLPGALRDPWGSLLQQYAGHAVADSSRRSVACDVLRRVPATGKWPSGPRRRPVDARIDGSFAP